jgi:hypothetical protein
LLYRDLLTVDFSWHVCKKTQKSLSNRL